MTAKPRIAIVTSLAPTTAEPHAGNPISQTALALQRWADVQVFYTYPYFPRWHIFQPRKYLYSSVDSRYFPLGLRAESIPFPAFPLLTRSLNGGICARYLMPYLQESHPDVILSYWLYPSGYGSLLVGEKLGIPVILGVRGSDLLAKPDILTRRHREVGLRRARYVLTVSDELRNRAIQFGASAKRVRSIPNGCDASIYKVADRQIARRKLGVESDSELIVFVGRLHPVKGLSDLMAATERLIPSHPRLKLVLIGEGVLEDQLKARVKRANLASHVLFLGQQPQPQVAVWLAAADFLCLPSHSEGCPNVVLEALSCGRPVVASQVGGIPELVNSHCGILFPPGDISRLCGAMNEALSRSWDEKAIASQYGRRWEDVAQETFEVCSDIIGKGAIAVSA